MGEDFLGRAEGKDHWSVADCFRDPSRKVSAFTHREYRIGMHTHEFIELNIVANGRGWHFMDGRKMEVGAGDAFAIPPLVEHGYVDEGGLDVCHVLLHPDYVTSNLGNLRWLDGYLMFFTVEPNLRRSTAFRHGFRLVGDAFSKALDLYQRLLEEIKTVRTGQGWACESLASLLIIQLCRAYSEAGGLQGASDSPHVKAAVKAIEHVASRHAVGVTLESMAKAAGLERSHFCRIFHKVSGMTPMEFVRLELAKEARRLLLEGDLNVSETAMRLGFCDAAHFSKSFRAATGRNPSELLKRD